MAHDSTDAEALSNALAYFSERVNLVFSYFYCVVEFEDDEDFAAEPFENGRAWALQTIRAACLHTTLIALRDLDDVLTPRVLKGSNKRRRTRVSDFRISDFGYPDGLSFLAPSDRDRINREIAHTTVPGSNQFAARWDIFELATKGVRQSLRFLQWAERQLADTHPTVSWEVVYCRTRTQKIHDYFAKIVEERPTK
jgi:hypothetical protein